MQDIDIFPGGFFSCLQGRTAKSNPSASFKSSWEFLAAYFLQSPHQVDIKNLVKCLKDFLRYSTTLKTYRVKSDFVCLRFLSGFPGRSFLRPQLDSKFEICSKVQIVKE